jgi:hypothetical protein
MRHHSQDFGDAAHILKGTHDSLLGNAHNNGSAGTGSTDHREFHVPTNTHSLNVLFQLPQLPPTKELGSHHQQQHDLNVISGTFFTEIDTGSHSSDSKFTSVAKDNHNQHVVVDSQSSSLVLLHAKLDVLNADDFFFTANFDKAQAVRARYIFEAHSDAITSVYPLHLHGCFVTLSLDGYQRLWNLEGGFLGELALPNITDEMKRSTRCTESGLNWNFILDRTEITPVNLFRFFFFVHIMFVNTLLLHCIYYCASVSLNKVSRGNRCHSMQVLEEDKKREVRSCSRSEKETAGGSRKRFYVSHQ